ncbi:hypothetical protein IHE45_15G056200 [Dioscorea alata]|uniref:Uncharacterized protein n=1 Tax=Dioscorea alata TaxID=55571 RepID=A0ACB7ULR3_DIOAL|nr:hypothetical protein IHE45_15G056200 [Dioscorea alata]
MIILVAFCSSFLAKLGGLHWEVSVSWRCYGYEEDYLFLIIYAINQLRPPREEIVN